MPRPLGTTGTPASFFTNSLVALAALTVLTFALENRLGARRRRTETCKLADDGDEGDDDDEEDDDGDAQREGDCSKRVAKDARTRAAAAAAAKLTRLKCTFLTVYALIMCSDWLQGPYVFSLYHDEYGISLHTIGLLFVCGFLSAGVSAPWIGKWADTFGRKRACLVFTVAYSLSCITKMIPSLPSLTFGRILGGLSTSILFSSPEAWLVSSARELNMDQTALAELLGRCTLVNGIVASLSGVFSDYLVARTGTFKSPFVASGALLVVAGVVIAATWDENHGRAAGETSCSNRSPWKSSFKALKRDPSLIVLGLCITVFEGAMYLWVFLPSPTSSAATSILTVDATATQNAPHECDPLLGPKRTPPPDSRTEEDLATAGVRFHARLLTFNLLLAAVALGASAYSTHARTRFFAFLVFEFSVGLYSLVLGLIVLGVLLVIWFVLHGKDQRLFQPRTILPPLGARAPPLENSPIGWLKGVISAPDSLVLEAQGPDAYFFLRFVRMGLMIFGPFFLLTWVVLMPVAGTGDVNGQGLDRFIFGNVGTDQQGRIIAYLLVAIVLTLWVVYLIDVEYKHYRIVRQQWLTSEGRAGLPETRTVVIVNVPKTYMSVESIKELASDCGTVQKVWLTRGIDALEEVYEARNKEIGILEGSEGSVLALAAKNVRKKTLPDPKDAATVEADELISQYIAKKKQPSHKRGLMGLFGAKVDTLNDSPAFIQEKEAELATLREGVDKLELGDTAFIRFATRQQAHAFVSTIGSGKATEKSLKRIKGEVEVMPEDIFWANTSKSANSRTIGGIIGWALTIFLIIIWAIPVALVGFISNIKSLTGTVKFLSFLNKLPPTVIGIIQGVLPPVLLAVLFMLLPIVLRKFVKMGGPVLNSQIELQLFSRFWLFQVIHGFLIVTLASGLLPALSNISAKTLPTLPTLLSQKLPTASTFFLQYLALYALTSFGLSVSRTVPFVMSKLGGLLSGPTPRKEWGFQNKMMAIALGTTWPPVALLMCVGIVYSCIQPVICLFGLSTFALLYVMYKYILIWVADQPDSLETGGEFFRKGIMTIFVALYLEMICLAGLFFLSKTAPPPGSAANATGPQSKEGLASGAIMIVLIVFVAVFHRLTTHNRQNARACHFIDGSMHLNSSKTIIHDGEENENTGSPSTYPPVNKEKPEAGPAYGNTTGLHDHAFDHPSLWKPAPIVWMADDSLGIARAEAARLNSLKIEASTEYATMDVDGKIDVTRGAPDEAWQDGINKI
ncbi:hypothetical protein RQP46_007749 [Phenoliferia psychrophenolica]